MIQSRGQLVLADTSPSFTTRFQQIPNGYDLTGRFGSYAALYQSQLWVYTLINKLALNTARLPLKAYRKTATGREDQRDSPFGHLLDNPNTKHSPFFLWMWTVSTFNIYGEAMWVKFRDAAEQVVEVAPLHPANVSVKSDPATGELVYLVTNTTAAAPSFAISGRDVVHFKSYHPDNPYRGLSPLEPLRLTLQSEFASRRAQAAYWANGARPAFFLAHPMRLGKDAMERLKANWDAIHTGVDNFGKTAILEEGMEPKSISMTARDSQYMEERKLNREEVCAVFDMPPPAVHILDHATFSNITEQMRSVYRDTMATRLKGFKSTIDVQLRPEFGDTDLYAEFDMDDVLRADFETRMAGHQTAINCGIEMPSEARSMENLPFVEGSDKLFVNSTMIPIEEAAKPKPDPALMPPAVPELPPVPVARALSEIEIRALMGRLGRVGQLGDVDPDELAQGMNGGSTFVKDAYYQAQLLNEGVSGFKKRIAALLEDA